MPFDLQAFARLRPFVYHLTTRDNLSRIRATRRLESAAMLAAAAGQLNVLRVRRTQSEVVTVAGSQVRLQSQFPLHEGNIHFEDDWKFENLLGRLNSLVFFWPGPEAGPISYGLRHYDSSLWDRKQLKVLRCKTSVLFASKLANPPLFCRYNSGAPRRNPITGKSPRGHNTFLRCSEFKFVPSEVKEVAFENEIVLPACTQLSDRPSGPWDLLSQEP